MTRSTRASRSLSASTLLSVVSLSNQVMVSGVEP